MVNVVAAISATRSDLRRVGTASQQHQPLALRAGLPGFAGQYRDNETGYTYLRNRYYDPGTTQYTTPNPLAVAGANPYSYAATNPVNVISPNGVTTSGGGSSGGGYPGLGTPPSLAPSSRAVWDKTLGPVISTANDACFENWTDAAVCAAVAAAAVGFGLGMEAILGASGLTGTAATFSTWLGAFSTAFQAVLTYADCRNGVDGSCVVNVAATVLAGLGLGLAGLGGKVAHGGAWVDLAVPLATFGLAASSAGAIFGLPPVGKFADSANEC